MSLPTPPGPAEDVEPFDAAPAELEIPEPHSSWEPTDWEPTDWEPDADAVDAAIAKRLGADSEDIYAAVRAAEHEAEAIADPHIRAAQPVIPAPQVPDDVGLDAPVSEKVSVRGVVEAAAAEVGQEIAQSAGPHSKEADDAVAPNAEPAANAEPTTADAATPYAAPVPNDAPQPETERRVTGRRSAGWHNTGRHSAVPADGGPEAPDAPAAHDAAAPNAEPAASPQLPPPPAPPTNTAPPADPAPTEEPEDNTTPRGFLPPPPAPPAS
ncbi:hypothetical protein QP228_001240 [Pseudoglutamicibacter cumminsii]|uniref:hypothetical protein n=1 Tax=Pseudoglutamicibacter cumminsii TaxID=156979 RepID=UPI002553A812|nr:hypothetical protein [Pseudoglutamicibacter cumminsii]MDZ3744651.1 hypothetical protein [Pseudoglutamicibacter cumminsii]